MKDDTRDQRHAILQTKIGELSISKKPFRKNQEEKQGKEVVQ